jgi:hypothetical protein
MYSACRRHRPDDEFPSAVHDVDDAIAVLAELAATYPDACYFALAMDRQHNGRLAIPIDGPAPGAHSDIEELAQMLTGILPNQDEGAACLILASRRDDTAFTTDDARCWQRLREHCRTTNFELLDWILVGHHEYRSMSETCGPGWPDPQ